MENVVDVEGQTDWTNGFGHFLFSYLNVLVLHQYGCKPPDHTSAICQAIWQFQIT